MALMMALNILPTSFVITHVVDDCNEAIYTLGFQHCDSFFMRGLGWFFPSSIESDEISLVLRGVS